MSQLSREIKNKLAKLESLSQSLLWIKEMTKKIKNTVAYDETTRDFKDYCGYCYNFFQYDIRNKDVQLCAACYELLLLAENYESKRKDIRQELAQFFQHKAELIASNTNALYFLFDNTEDGLNEVLKPWQEELQLIALIQGVIEQYALISSRIIDNEQKFKKVQQDLSAFIERQTDSVSFVLQYYDLLSQLPYKIINDSTVFVDSKPWLSGDVNILYKHLHPVRIKNELIDVVDGVLALDFDNPGLHGVEVLNKVANYFRQLSSKLPEAQWSKYCQVFLKSNDAGKTLADYAHKNGHYELLMLVIPSIKKLHKLQAQIKTLQANCYGLEKVKHDAMLADLRKQVGEDLAKNVGIMPLNDNLLYSIWYNGDDFLDCILTPYRGDVSQVWPQKLKSEIANLLSIDFSTSYSRINSAINIKSIYHNLAYSINTMVNLNIFDKSVLLQTNDNKQTVAHYAFKHIKDMLQAYYQENHSSDAAFEVDASVANFLLVLKPFAANLRNLKDSQGNIAIDYAKMQESLSVRLCSSYKISDLAQELVARYGFNELDSSWEVYCCNLNFDFPSFGLW